VRNPSADTCSTQGDLSINATIQRISITVSWDCGNQFQKHKHQETFTMKTTAQEDVYGAVIMTSEKEVASQEYLPSAKTGAT
jgi:hypothetical protein